MATVTKVYVVKLDYNHVIPYEEFISAIIESYDMLKSTGAKNLRVLSRSTTADGDNLKFIFEEDYDIDKEDLKEAISEFRSSLLKDKFNIDITQEEIIQLIKEKL